MNPPPPPYFLVSAGEDFRATEPFRAQGKYTSWRLYFHCLFGWFLSEHVYIHMLKISSCPFFGVFLRFCFLLEVLLFFVDDISSFSQDVSKGLTTHLNSLLMGWFPWVFVFYYNFKHFGFNGIDLWKDSA